MSKITESRDEVAVAAIGVVSLESGGIRCNTEDLHAQLLEAVRRQKPGTDYYGSFAADVMLIVRFRGEMEEENGDEIQTADLQ